ncbi:hypothetical protein L7F22_035191, partial [Adiantum nelumboides]|nr:hypothetical protein [Adiantum nelumboides]
MLLLYGSVLGLVGQKSDLKSSGEGTALERVPDTCTGPDIKSVSSQKAISPYCEMGVAQQHRSCEMATVSWWRRRKHVNAKGRKSHQLAKTLSALQLIPI